MTPRPVRPRVPPPGMMSHDVPVASIELTGRRVWPEDPSGDDVITFDPPADPADVFRARIQRAVARRLAKAPGLTDAAKDEIARAFDRAVADAEAGMRSPGRP